MSHTDMLMVIPVGSCLYARGIYFSNQPINGQRGRNKGRQYYSKNTLTLKKAYGLCHSLRMIFSRNTIKDAARLAMARWYYKVEEAGMHSFNVIAATFYEHYDEILNFYNHRSSNAMAESFNAKIKLFRANLRGVADLRLAFASSKPVRLVGGNSVYNYIQHGGNITHVFKLTADYEHIFHKERLQAIPEEEHARYMPVMIYRRLRMLRRILRCAQKDNTVGELRTSVFVKELIADIHATRYAFWRYPHWRLWRFLASAGK